MERIDLAKELVGKRMELRYLEYNWRDVALYALAVGAKRENLMYTYEKELKALPAYGTILYWGMVNVRPYQWIPLPASILANEIIQPTISFLNMDHELIMYRPIDPIKGTFQYQDRVTDVYDRSEGKGAVVKTQIDVRDEAGNLVCINRSTIFFHEAGGFGGPLMPKSDVVIPDEPERMKRMAAQMTSVLYPDTKIKLQLWKMDEGKAYFRLLNLSTGKAVLNRGVFEWE